MKFQKRRSVIEATQWFAPGDHPAVEERNGAWSVATPEGWHTVQVGDWIITSSEGEVFCMSDALFVDRYEPLVER
ncbi:hypothetical protein VOM14_21955 [Paraburkholderia sp. MPAMCS5]|uniref:hypothetical protein n=1 Tax=Paraburkholderia sp. MPAMCS5 TaxID=3112563 RepID=UPI002E16EAF5|nr:hypothetical protein [Paraburkholderia sp. MPAMCS5]